MTTTILQSFIGRCRDDFSTGSATVVLVSGTRRRLTGLTAGSYLDVSAVASFAIGAAADAMMQVFVGATVAAASAIGEGASQSVVTATDWGSMSVRTMYGPITAAQAASGLVVDLRIATSANTLTISAVTTPTKYGAELRINEVSSAAPTLPTAIPNLLAWFKADTGVTYDKTTARVSAWTDSGTARRLAYKTQTGNFTAGLVVTGGTSGATATIHNDVDGGATGTLTLVNISGTFVDAEIITDSSTGSATVNGAVSAISLAAGTTAPKYEASVVNSLPGLYFDGNEAASLTFSAGVGQGTAFEVFAVVSVSAALRVGAVLLDNTTADDGVRVLLSNATVNRNALYDVGKPEYVSTTTTITSGKALMRWRYNLGTTTGAAGVNGNAEVADTSFDPPLDTWSIVGSSDGTSLAIGDFRLCELIIFSVPQATTEDAMSVSDVTSMIDYLNGRWAIY